MQKRWLKSFENRTLMKEADYCEVKRVHLLLVSICRRDDNNNNKGGGWVTCSCNELFLRDRKK
ncbi:UNVERIFIED_CONTAM: hypothetical protein NCL1_08777 [Trichonephila clavipes]